jgi:hAT family protein
MFDNLPSLSAPSSLELRDELDQYLSTDPEQVGGNTGKDVITWWYERRGVYPRLHRMALDYLTIPGMYYFIYLI